MAYEGFDEALRQLKTDRERREATENQRKTASAEARIQFVRIKSTVTGPIFHEVVARLVAEVFFGKTIEQQNNASCAIPPSPTPANRLQRTAFCHQTTSERNRADENAVPTVPRRRTVRAPSRKFRIISYRAISGSLMPPAERGFGNDRKKYI
jgi:hypothetical protein